MIAIAGGKGGCGKTTTACGLARALANRRTRPVVVDADVDMPDLHERIRARPEPGLDAVAAGEPLSAVLQTDHDLAGVDVVASGETDDLAPGLARLARLDAPVIVDCPAGAGPDVARALQVADRAVVVSTDTRASLEDAAKTAAMSRTLGTPVVALVLRETRRGGSVDADDRLRRLVEAPTVVRIPTYQGNNPLARVGGGTAGVGGSHLTDGCQTGAESPSGVRALAKAVRRSPARTESRVSTAETGGGPRREGV